MAKKTFFVITEKSEMERWDIHRSKLNINQAMLDGLTTGMVRKLLGIFPMSAVHPEAIGAADISVGPSGFSVVRMPVFKLPLSAPYAVEGTTVYPHFDGAHPIISQHWVPPENMRLFLCAHINSALECVEQFLVAIDPTNKCWRLPVSNLYDNCRLCPGRHASNGSNVLQVCQRAWAQFQASNWNADLYGDASPLRRSCSKALFTFDVSNEKFTQRKPPTKWWDLCEKVATEFLTNYVMH